MSDNNHSLVVVFQLPPPPPSERPAANNNNTSFLSSSSSGYQCAESNWEGLKARPLFLALKEYNLDKLEQLLLSQSQSIQQSLEQYTVNDLDGDKAGLLHNYALNAQDDIEYNRRFIDIIIKAGGDIDILHGKFKETPLSMAVKYSQSSFVQALLERNARMDIGDIWGDTPILSAKTICSMHNNNDKDNNDNDNNIEKPCCKTLKLLENEQHNEARQVKLREQMERAEILRIQGNDAVAKNDIASIVQARELYTESLIIYEDYRTFSNRALCSIKLGKAWLKDALDKGGKGVPWRKRLRDKNNSSYLEYSNETRGWGEAAIFDAGRAARMEPTFSKAYYRKAMGHVLLRDFPRAKHVVMDGLKHCRTDRHLCGLLKIFNMWKVPNTISNPFSQKSRQATERINNSLSRQEEEPTTNCGFCRACIPISMLIGSNDSTCISCAMNEEDSEHVTEEMILDLIFNH